MCEARTWLCWLGVAADSPRRGGYRSRGADVSVILGGSAADVQSVPLHQLEIVGHLPILVQQARFDGASANLVLDALIGYSLSGAPRQPIATLISSANASLNP